jgi:hypothetical protein
MKKFISLMIAAIGAVCVSVAALSVNAQNQFIFEDHFDDGVLDPAWSVVFTPDGGAVATGWDYDESVERASWLTVREILGANTNSAEWKLVDLKRSIPPVGDFNITMKIAWATPPPFEVFSQVLLVFVYDGSGTAIVSAAGYNDSWSNDYGTHFVAGPCVTQNPGGFYCHDPSSAGLNGEATVEIDRTGNQFTFTWNGPGARVYTSPVSTADAEQVMLTFRVPAYDITNFGTLAIDRITVEGTLKTVVHRCSGFQPPFDRPMSIKRNAKRAIPLKAVITDAGGTILSDIGLPPPVVKVAFNGTVYGKVPPDDVDLVPLGQANTDNILSFDVGAGRWHYNLDTGQFPATGLYTVSVVSGDPNVYSIDVTEGCTGTFERVE